MAMTTAAAADSRREPDAPVHGDAHRSFCDFLDDEGNAKTEASAGQAGQSFKGFLLTPAANEPGKSSAPAAAAVADATAGAPVITTRPKPITCADTFEGAVRNLRRGLVGRHTPFRTPFGLRPLVYSDWTATGRAMACIERYLYKEVLPLFGNTHTTTSITGAQTTCFRHEARQIIAEAVNAKVTGRAAEDVVLFTGTGATAAVAKLVSAIGLSGPLPRGLDPNDRPVVFVGPFEHHSNLLPWRESCAEVVTIRERGCGGLDLEELRDQLRCFKNRKLKIGSFSAASNVTGGLEDVDRVTATLHRAGALALWDYATAAPYVRMDMNPVASGTDDQALVAKDAIFFSGHKFVGGTGTPGVLVVKKSLLRNAVPGTVGGGTVFFVTQDDHRYLSNKEEREEGGTPDIMGSIRLGLAVQMKEKFGRQAILEREEALAEMGLRTLRGHPKIAVLGDTGRKRLPIFSFLVRSADGRYLHYNFVCALLNDLFGVQSRGGCQCAGPYSQRLLGMSPADTRAVEAELLCKHELLRPGFSRFSLAYINSDREAKYILDAVLFVADHGFSFLPQYRVNYKTGEWKHKTRFTRFPERRWLGHCDYGFPTSSASIHKVNGDALSMGWAGPVATESPKTPGAWKMEGDREKEMMEGVFEEALRHLRAAEAGSGEDRWQGAEDVLGGEGEALRWFPYPWEGGSSSSRNTHDTDAARPASSSAPPAEIAPAAASSSVAGVKPAPPPVGKASSSPSSPSSGRCIIRPAVYGPGGERADVAIPLGGRVEEAGTGLAEEAVALSSNGAITSYIAATAAAAAAGSCGGGGGSGGAENAAAAAGSGESVAAGERGDAHGEEGLPKSVIAVVETTSPDLARSEALESGNGIGLPGVQGTSGLAEDAGGAKKKLSRKKESPTSGKPRKFDDRHKYPLRKGGDIGFVTEEASALSSESSASPPFSYATSSVAIGNTSSSNGHGVSGGAVNSKQKGYEVHMATLGKLGAGSVASRLFPKPGKKILRAVGQAVQGWKMIEEGDRLCLGLSGGKDSMTLLHVLLDLQKRAPINFELSCATVDPQTASFDPSPLIPYLERLGVTLHYLSSPIIEQAKTSMQGDSLCAFCARMKRGLLYSCCREHGYNKLVLAQHLDDLAESFIMSALHNGQVRTMKANYEIEAGDVRVIRPLCYAREALTKEFARTNRLPVVNENCPACFEEPKERHRVKKMLAKEESLFPAMYANLRRALVPLMDNDAYVAMGKTSAEVSARQATREYRPSGTKNQPPVELGPGDGTTASPAEEDQPSTETLPSATSLGKDGLKSGIGAATAAAAESVDPERLADFSDVELERELARRRHRGAEEARTGETGGVNSGGVCAPTGGVCVPCFEIA